MAEIEITKPTTEGTGPKKVRSMNGTFLVLVALVAGFLGGYAGNNVRNKQATTTQTTEARQQILSTEGEQISQVAKDVGASVVSITVESQTTGGYFFDTTTAQSAGTGIIVSKDGLVVTNKHVVEAGTTNIVITLSDGTQLSDVSVVDRDTVNDVAFLKIKDTKGKTLTPAKLGDSSKMKVGDKVVAIGNALGEFQNTVTSGIVSGIGSSIEAGDESGSSESLQNLLQTDAAINRGNSGGPLVNLSGEVIGINTAITGSDNGQSLGFAIPMNDVKPLLDMVLSKGKIERPYLGVRFVSVTDDVAYEYNLPVKRGAYLAPSRSGSTVISGSPADKAGLKEKDIITKVNDTVVDEKTNLVTALTKYKVGDTVKVTYYRDGKEQTLQAKLEAAPGN